jgi:hypothetical protein
MLIMVIAAVAFMIFGGVQGLVGGAFVLWYLATMIIPCVYGERLVHRFGTKWGMTIAYAPLWVPIVLGLSAGLWLPLFGIH